METLKKNLFFTVAAKLWTTEYYLCKLWTWIARGPQWIWCIRHVNLHWVTASSLVLSLSTIAKWKCNKWHSTRLFLHLRHSPQDRLLNTPSFSNMMYQIWCIKYLVKNLCDKNVACGWHKARTHGDIASTSHSVKLLPTFRHVGGLIPGTRGVGVWANISRVCRTTRYEKSCMSLNHLALTRDLPDVTASKLIARTQCFKIQFGICVEIFVVLFW